MNSVSDCGLVTVVRFFDQICVVVALTSIRTRLVNPRIYAATGHAPLTRAPVIPLSRKNAANSSPVLNRPKPSMLCFASSSSGVSVPFTSVSSVVLAPQTGAGAGSVDPCGTDLPTDQLGTATGSITASVTPWAPDGR